MNDLRKGQADRLFQEEIAQVTTVTDFDLVHTEYRRRLALIREAEAIDRAVARDREHSTGELRGREEGDDHA